MKIAFRYLSISALIVTSLLVLASFTKEKSVRAKFSFPYKQSGLTEREAAAHLLNRFTYGIKPGEIDAVLKVGLEKWFASQLKANLEDKELKQMLDKYDALQLSNAQVVEKYPRGGLAIRMAIKDGYVHKDSVDQNRADYRQIIKKYMDEKGLRPQQELYRQFISQKILRAAYSQNQVQEVLTEFWFNHFNVSLDKGQCAEFIPAYERDVIRPNVFQDFNVLLLATAKSPAMLRYLDNFSSAGPMEMPKNAKVKKPANNNRGLNENYAREVMELHTLGVDGGYSQQDVTQAARVLTGWTIAPMNDGYSDGMKKIMENSSREKLLSAGYVFDGDFMFVPNRHDKGEKTVLDKYFPEGGGYEEGVTLLNMLANHPSTAKFISRKLAVRFVSDNPPQSLIDKMAKTFREKKGNLREVMITMVTAPEFWNKEALREKTKSPFELAMSAVRSLDAEITQPYQLFTWINKMGQKIYYYQAPTGFPDRAAYWINTGSLLNRMNFGLAIASQRIPGVKFNIQALNQNREPESAEAALYTYSKIMMPERNIHETVKRLKPMVNDPELVKKVEAAANKNQVRTENMMMNEEASLGEDMMGMQTMKEKNQVKSTQPKANIQANAGSNMLAQVVGVIIGSPEFQRK